MSKKIHRIGCTCRTRWTLILIAILLVNILSILFENALLVAEALRPSYVYDNANVIDPYYMSLLEQYLRAMDEGTSTEIMIYTLPSFIGHGIKKDGNEINDRDMLANFLFNEATLNGIKGIGKKGKDNGVLVLFSLKPDSGGGSMRIEVGRGL